MKKAVEEPEEEYRTIGRTTIAPEVLVTIARLTALEVPGVSRMAGIPRTANRLLARGTNEGVRLDIQEDEVYADIYLVLNNGVNILEVSRRVQAEIARSISKMVGMHIGQINIHIEDIDFPAESENL
ncbi:MAG: hypothetical protein A2Z16_08615 [Chloroflexi bacterium RBG_16_54_18]|nr:MAG: hypothetical protein A2Z16_08615 [Chloroflexi bacterium RBG_16_54_18]